jgi:hypothetical protein
LEKLRWGGGGGGGAIHKPQEQILSLRLGEIYDVKNYKSFHFFTLKDHDSHTLFSVFFYISSLKNFHKKYIGKLLIFKLVQKEGVYAMFVNFFFFKYCRYVFQMVAKMCRVKI